MTNREWLFSLTDEELAGFLFSPVYQSIYRSYASSELGIKDWLNRDSEWIESHYNKATGCYKLGEKNDEL